MQIEMSQFVENLIGSLDEVVAEKAAPTANFEEFTNWDSLAALSVIVMINTEYGVEVSGAELKACTTPEQLCNLVKTKLN